MARRITPKAPDSLLKAKQKEQQALSVAELANREATEISSNIKQLKAEENQALADANAAKELLAQTRSDIKLVNSQIEEAVAELRDVKGELIQAREKVALADKELGVLLRDTEALTHRTSAAHKEKIAAITETQAQASNQEKAALLRLEGLGQKVALMENRLVDLKKQEEVYNRTLVPKKTELEATIENLNHQVLVVKNEVQTVEKQLTQVQGKLHDETVLLEETVAKRRAEEARIAELHTQLATREGEVEKKTQTLREVQAGVNQSLARLEREKSDTLLKQHLSQGKVTEE